MKICIILVLTAWIFLSSCNSVYAEENDIGTSLIHPAHPFYFLKTVRERIEMHLAKTQRVKILRELEFATRRIREVNALLPTKNQDLIEPTLERYWSHTNSVLQIRPKEEWLTLLLNQIISIHLNVLEKIYDQVDEKRAKMSIRTAIFRLLDNSDIEREPKAKGCEFLSKEASSSALNQTERAILQSRVNKCFQSLQTNL